jgi:hypothetical protein
MIEFSDESMNLNQYEDILSRVIDKDDDWYYSDTTRLTNSMMGELKKSPLHLQCYLRKVEGPELKHNVFGRAFHCAVLEPLEFEKRFYVVDDREICQTLINDGAKNPRAKKEYKEWKANILAENEDKTELSWDDWESIIIMRDKVLGSAETFNLLEKTEKEKIVSNTIEGVDVKIKADAIRYGDYIIDLKSTMEPVTKFSNSFWKYDYARQAAFYSDVTGIKNVIFIVVEKTFPYTVGIYTVSQETLQSGRASYLHLLNMYKNLFINVNTAPDFSNYIIKGSI